MVLDKAYFHLVHAYLFFFLPTRPPLAIQQQHQQQATSPTSTTSANPMTPNKSFNAQYGPPFGRTSVLSAKQTPPVQHQQQQQSAEILDNSNVFKCSSVENLALALSSAQFAVEVLAEVWFGLNEWEIEGERNNNSTLVYAKPQVCFSVMILSTHTK